MIPENEKLIAAGSFANNYTLLLNNAHMQYVPTYASAERFPCWGGRGQQKYESTEKKTGINKTFFPLLQPIVC